MSSYHLNIDWTTSAGEHAPAQLSQLRAVLRATDGSETEAQIQGRRLHFAQLTPGFYTLHLSYDWSEDPAPLQSYSSFAFGLDVPDITLMKLNLTPQGAQVEQMGALNDYGEFMDMKLSDEALYLTRPTGDYPVLQALAAQLVPTQDLPSPEALDEAVGTLDQAFADLQALWAYQLRKLIQPTLLAQLSIPALAVWQHLLSNHLELMDDERLQERLLVAIEDAQAQDAVASYLALLSWDPLTQTWQGLSLFLERLQGQRLLK